MRSEDDEDTTDLRFEESRVRSKLANERTFAAWLRTSITVMVVGLAVAQFIAETEGERDPWIVALGGGYVVAGAGLTGWAIYNYLTDRKQMKKHDFEAPKRSLVAIAVVLALLSLAVLVLIARV